MASPSFQPSALSYEQVGEPHKVLPNTRRSTADYSTEAALLPELPPPVVTEGVLGVHTSAVLMIGGIALVALLPFVVGPWAVKQFKPEWGYGKRLVTSVMVSIGIGIIRTVAAKTPPAQSSRPELWSGSLTTEGVERV